MLLGRKELNNMILTLAALFNLVNLAVKKVSKSNSVLNSFPLHNKSICIFAHRFQVEADEKKN
jgi:hypothetical protein